MASDGEIPESLLRFIDANVESIDHLEILRVLGDDPDRSWSAENLAIECQVKATNLAANLAWLEKRGLLTTRKQGPGISIEFAPRTPELADGLKRLLRFYQERPVTLIKMIYARSTDRLRAFADAFRLRAEE